MSSYDVLVVDDESDVRTYLSAALRDSGLTVRCVPNAVEALNIIREEKPQVMLLDLIMPDMSGDELCRIIKQDPQLRDIVIFILTSKSDVETKLNLFQMGAEEYLVKPVDTRELRARVGRFIRLLYEWKTPVPGSLPFQEDSYNKSTPGTDQNEMKSLVLEDYSFLHFQSVYGNYRVESLVGKGGMGQVFKARDVHLDRYVAIKVLSKRLSSSHEFVERFRREAKVLASITHAGIASIYSFSEQNGEHYFAMQWCPGGSLSELIRKKGRIDLMNATEILLQCARALDAASKKGVVHRDIKPSNLMFDENGLVKIVDFGLAFVEQLSSHLTQGGEFLGTPGYMAPEQAKSPSVDHRADIYSLGITFYHMLYGHLPFQASSAIEMVLKHASQPFPPYDDLNGQIPPLAYSIITRMTAKEPEARYQEYVQLIQDLEKLKQDLLQQLQLKVPRAGNPQPLPAIRDTDFFGILATIHSKGLSGTLHVKWSALRKKFLIRLGEIVLFESIQAGENIWLVLLQKGYLKKEDVPVGEVNLEEALNRFLQERVFSLEDFKHTYSESMRAALNQVFLWPVFEGEFQPAPIEPEGFCSIPIADFLLDAARHQLDYNILKTRVPENVFLSRTENFDVILRSLHLHPEESFIASRLEGENITLQTLNLLTGLREETILRLVYILEKFGAIRYKTETQRPIRKTEEIHPPASSPLPPPAREATKAVPPVQPSPKIEPPRGASAIMDNYYAELQKKRFVKETPEPHAPPKESQIRMELQKTEKKMEIEQHVKVAEQFYRMAERKMEEEDYYRVTALCKQAIANNPGEAKYYVLMAKAYARHPRFLKDAEISYQKAIELDRWNPDYHIELAEFYLSQGLSLRALTECKKAVSITPEHKKAQKLLEILKKKEKE